MCILRTDAKSFTLSFRFVKLSNVERCHIAYISEYLQSADAVRLLLCNSLHIALQEETLRRIVYLLRSRVGHLKASGTVSRHLDFVKD